MAADLLYQLTERAAAHQRTLDTAHLNVAVATEPTDVRAWLNDFGLLISLDLARHLVAGAFGSILDLAGDTRLDGNLATHLPHLHTLTDTALDIDIERTDILRRFLDRGDRLGILFPAEPVPSGPPMR